MSYLSATENVGYSGINQSLSEASCATQYKMAVETVPTVCGEMNSFINDGSGSEQAYLPHINENYFQSKFKFDPNELYTFTDSDVVAGEVTVSNCDGDYIIAENDDDKKDFLDSPRQEIFNIENIQTNGIIKEEDPDPSPNGHYMTVTKPQPIKKGTSKSVKSLKNQPQGVNDKVQKANLLQKIQRSNSKDGSSKPLNEQLPGTTLATETFLDVFKREQGLTEGFAMKLKVESEPPPLTPIIRNTASNSLARTPSGKSLAVAKTPSSGKTATPVPKKPASSTPSSSKSSSKNHRRGRGPTLHEALQRIPKRAIPEPVRPWHSPGYHLFNVGPLNDLPFTRFRKVESSSDEEDIIPRIGQRLRSMDDMSLESRSARLSLRSATLRRQVSHATAVLKLRRQHSWQKEKALVNVLKTNLEHSSSSRVPPQVLNYLLVDRGMASILSPLEKRQLRTTGWSGGESVDRTKCSEQNCTDTALPCSSHCLKHVTNEPTQRLYARCAAVFPDGKRCTELMLSLAGAAPLCQQHQWKRDSYEKNRESKKMLVRKQPSPPSPRRPKRRRRPPVKQKPVPTQVVTHTVTDLNSSVCSNSSAYESGDETTIGPIHEHEFIVHAADVHELEVGQVPPDDILDPAVLSQIPDEAFTEFFNQAEGGGPFAESSDLARALEAVLDEKALDSLTDIVPQNTRVKLHVPTAVMEMSSSAPS